MMTKSRGRRAPRAARGVGGVLLAALITLSGAGIAQAYLGSGGSGAGTGLTGSSGTLTLSPASVTDALYPGETATVSLTAKNPDNADVVIGTLALDTSRGTSGFSRASGSTSCGMTTFSFTSQDNNGEGWTVPAKGSVVINLPDAVAASTSTASACQGATLTVYLKAS